MKNPFEELTYKGHDDKSNPMRFVKRFKKLAIYEGVNNEEQLHYFSRCMRGPALTWFELNDFEEIDEAIAEFKEKFWGEEAQARFREKMYTAKFNYNAGSNMAEYAMEAARQASLLEPCMTDSEIIRCLKRHFDKETTKEIRPSIVKTVKDLIVLLEELDNERKDNYGSRANDKRIANTENRNNSREGLGNRNPRYSDRYDNRNDNRNDNRSDNRYENRSGNRNENRSGNRYDNRYTRNYREENRNGYRGGYRNYQRDNRDVKAIEYNKNFRMDKGKSKNDGGSSEEERAVGQRGRENEQKRATNKVREQRAEPKSDSRFEKTSRGYGTGYNSRKLRSIKVEKEVEDLFSSGNEIKDERNNESNKSNNFERESNNNLSHVEETKSQVKKNKGKVSRDGSIRRDRENRFAELTKKEDDLNLSIIRTNEIVRDFDETCEVMQKECRDSEPYIRVVIGEIKIEALVDTGAQVSAITKRVFDELNNAEIEMISIPIKKFNLKGAFNDRGNLVAYKIQVDINVNDSVVAQEFYVVDKLVYPMVLGYDFLKKHSAKLSRQRNSFAMNLKVSEEAEARVAVLSVKDANKELQTIVARHESLFENEIGRINNYEHEIKVSHKKGYKSKTYPIPDVHKESIAEFLKELEQKGIIEKTATQFINPLVAVRKKSGDIRLCLDARELNKRTLNDHAQSPTIDEVFRRVGHKKYFSTLDVRQAYWQIPLTEESKQYTGFIFDNQTYVFKRMPFGLKTAGASFFTRAMDITLGGENNRFLTIYLDDLLIASNTLEEHLVQLEYVFEKLESAGFKLNLEKCELLKTEIKFLGHTFNELEANINEDTRMTIRNFDRPRTKKAL